MKAPQLHVILLHPSVFMKATGKEEKKFSDSIQQITSTRKVPSNSKYKLKLTLSAHWLRTFSNHGIRHCLFHRIPPFRLVFFLDFVASFPRMRLFSAFSARVEMTLDAFECRHFLVYEGDVVAFGTLGCVAKSFDYGLVLEFVVFFHDLQELKYDHETDGMV